MTIMPVIAVVVVVGRVRPLSRSPSRERRHRVAMGTVGETRSSGPDQVPSLERGSELADHG